MEGARSAVSQMVDLLCARYGMSAVDAYMLCSVCADLRISEIVDLPNWVVSFYFPADRAGIGETACLCWRRPNHQRLSSRFAA
jgi:acetamidase/formamidase